MTETAEQDLRIRVRELTKSFGDAHVLRGIDFDSPRGSSTVLLGPSGSGKTTLLRSLNALETPERGVVRIDDVEVDFATLPKGKAGRREAGWLRAQSGMVFQAHNLFPHRTVLENIIEGPVIAQQRPREEAVTEAKILLDQVGLGDRADAYPYQLSGGQQQRVGIARALALKPRVVLFDEPTSALDPELVGEVLAVIKDLAAQGWTMVIVTHEIRFAGQVADQVLFLDGGVIVEHGPGGQVIEDPREERTRRFLKRILDPG
ncbi:MULTISPECIES: amino acid ABC transporter ATP-binding protein [unclassified Crossiella]|uniref:amino acid ABC transporter ATP-binding protein n=1 Tax=unclassified Crossiella TaxID=2620835 RepID=UPI00200031BB|nr:MULTISPECIES: amino acid ABC transporter ATP-binding protein [unclassified Crossiella]MCK2244691.1 amino acid ABC transporter ATP-binding protein [Crossiella sp. S99.2]MCK2258322.1 amino acid ABC transporter ATP-binding protein [Crossiella sp. S99.1]